MTPLLLSSGKRKEEVDSHSEREENPVTTMDPEGTVEIKENPKIPDRLKEVVKAISLNQNVNPENIKDLTQYSPAQVTDSIFKHPPTVFKDKLAIKPHFTDFKPPFAEDKKLAEEDLSALKAEDSESTQTLQTAIGHLQKFLGLGYYKDGFQSHNNQRFPWQMAILQALNLLDEEKKLRSTDDLEKYFQSSYSISFKNRWDANKFPKNSIVPISIALSYLEVIGNNVAAFQDRFARLPISKDANNYLADTLSASMLARDVLGFIKETYTSPEE